MKDIIIIGGGPAGLSAALYAGRSGFDSLIIAKGGGTLERIGKIENYFGVPGAPSGRELLEAGRRQVRELGVETLGGEVFGVTWEGSFTVSSDLGEYQSSSVILATGTSRRSVSIAGLDAYDGRGVSWCAVCDAFFFRGKRVAVLGAGEYALHELSVLLPLVGSAALVTGGGKLSDGLTVSAGVEVVDDPVESLYGGETLSGLRFKSGRTLEVDGLFVALGSAGASELARKAGAALTSEGGILTDAGMATTVPGLFAAGDCTGGVLQISAAVGEGARAALSAIKYVKTHKSL